MQEANLATQPAGGKPSHTTDLLREQTGRNQALDVCRRPLPPVDSTRPHTRVPTPPRPATAPPRVPPQVRVRRIAAVPACRPPNFPANNAHFVTSVPLALPTCLCIFSCPYMSMHLTLPAIVIWYTFNYLTHNNDQRWYISENIVSSVLNYFVIYKLILYTLLC